MSNRRAHSKKGKVIAIIAIIVIILSAIVYKTSFSDSFGESKTPVYQLAYYYGNNNKYVLPDRFSYEKGSPEDLFAKGLLSYSKGEYEKAEATLKKAEAKLDSATDKALPFYLYCYLNLSIYDATGEGDFDYVEKAVNAAYDYMPALNDHYHFWLSVYSIAVDEETDAIAMDYLEGALSYSNNLKTDALIRYNNCIAMLDFFDENYGKSIRRFYDVKEMFKGVHLTRFLQGQMLFTNSYIALFYYEFEDYETAIQLFNDNIAVKVDDPVVNAERKYSDYINLASAYLELNDTKNAIRICDKTEEILPYISDDIKDSVMASMYDNYACAAIIDKDFKKAQEYIDKEEKYLLSSNHDAFYGDEEFLKLTNAKLNIAKNDYDAARQPLEEILENKKAAYAGIDTEVNELLLDIYDKIGDKENYYKTLSAIRESEVAFNQTLKTEYMEFTQYYEKAEILSKENQILEDNKKVTGIIILVIVFALLLSIFIILIIRKGSFVDSLTGIRNRKALHAYAKKYESKGIPENTCIIMLDIDYFKLYNDTYGHIYGDTALKKVATAIKDSIRRHDFLIRYGGEEFLVILENIDSATAHEICERIIRNVQKKNIEHKASEISDVVTVSLGMCINENDGTTLDELLKKADEALYRAKTSGRNRVSE